MDSISSKRFLFLTMYLIYGVTSLFANETTINPPTAATAIALPTSSSPMFDTTQLETDTMPTFTGTTGILSTTINWTSDTSPPKPAAVTPTSPYSYREWMVNDTNGKPCMLMQIGGYFSVSPVDTEIPPDVSVNASRCNDHMALFNLYKTSISETINMSMIFDRRDDTYKMTRLSYSYSFVSAGFILFDSCDIETDFLEVSTGDYFICDEVQTYCNYTFTHMKFQPFLTGDGKYGEEFRCNSSSSKHVNVLLIICVTLLCVLVIGAVCFGFQEKKKKLLQTL